METTQPQDTAALGRALLDFARAPGLYALRLGEPRLLFAQMDTVAAWALGRVPPGYEAHADELARASVLFVQRACLTADMQQRTHYQVLGLTPEATTYEALRQRYRALIRLAHPDMGVQGLPPQAATRVNQAYETLADPAQREAYDQGLIRQTAKAAMAAARPMAVARRPGGQLPAGGHLAARLHARLAPHSRSLRRGAGVAAVLAAAGAMLLWALDSGQESRMLVVARAPVATTAAPAPAPAPDSALFATTAPAFTATPAPARPAQVQQPQPAQKAQPALANAYAPAAAPAPWTPPALPALPAPATTTPLQAAAAAPAPLAAATPTPAPAAQPAPPLLAVAAPRVWNVDALGARHYLTVLLSTLEKPLQARRANTQLADMRVQGSLLQPALGLMRQFPEIDVERMNWTDAERPGVLRVQGMVVLRASNPAVSESRTVNYRLSAEFRGTREGTVLAELELKEGD